MLQISFIRENRDDLIERLKIKNFHDEDLIDKIIETDDERRSLQLKQDKLQASLNAKSKEIGVLFKEGRQQEANQVKETTASLKEEIKDGLMVELSILNVEAKCQKT